MGAPFTQIEIQAEIDFYKDAMRTAASSQKYSYDEGPVGQFGVEKGKLEDIQKSLQYWIDMMNEYYPTVFAPGTTAIKLYEIGLVDG